MAGTELVRRRFRVGVVVLAALLALAFGIFMVGRRSSLFSRKTEYVIHFASASGLTPGNSVRLSGVNIGTVSEVQLSETPGDTTVTVRISIERRMASRVRTDTVAAIKTLGLLGDKYIELDGGSASAAQIAPGGEIPPAPQAGLEKLLAGGEGLLGDLTVIARSLKTILGRAEKGEGLVGELTTNSRQGGELRSNLNRTLGELSTTLAKINSGKSLAGKILTDEAYGKATGASLRRAIDSASTVLARLSQALSDRNTAAGALLSDPEGRRKVLALIDNLSQAGISLARVSQNLQSGQGVLPTLLNDEEFGRRFRQRLDDLSAHLDSISRKLDEGDGSLGRLINDPSLFDAANDVVVGVNDSKLLRWLIRNRQKKGIRDRYDKEKAKEKP